MLKKWLGSAFLALGLSCSAQAALIEYDWETQGDGNVSFDTQTGLLWLDLDVTKNKSINEVAALLSTDPRYAGYRLPTLDEIYTLAANLFNAVANVTSGTRLSGVSTGVTNQEKLNHVVMGGHSANYTYGIYSKDGVGTHLFGSGSNGLYFNYAWQSTSKDWKRNLEGVYLVADKVNLTTTRDAVALSVEYGLAVSDVNAPILGGMGLLLLGAGALRRKKV